MFVLLVMSVLLLRGIGDSSLGYPDADRFLMNGVFILDFIREMPLRNVYEFTANYYAQYPALNIGYSAPFFPAVEALFNAVFGINIWSSRLAVLAFAVVGTTAWFKLVQRVFDSEIAFWASLLLVTTPFVAMWGWYTMGEIPVLSMAMLTAYVFYRFTETQRRDLLYTAAILFFLAVWTKQIAVFLAIWFVLYLGIKRQLVNCLKRKDVWISLSIVGVSLIPLGLVTLWFGDQNIQNAMGPNGQGVAWRPMLILTWENLKVLFALLVTDHLTLPVLILSLSAMVWAAWRRDPRGLYFALLILSTYFFFSLLEEKSSRYSIFWIPGFTLFAALPLLYLRRRKFIHIIATVVLAVVTVYQVTQTYAIAPNYATGYEEAARFIVRESKGPTVFFDGHNNGYFIYFTRAFDPKRSLIILRGDKLLSSSSIMPRQWLKVHAHSRTDLENMIKEYGPSHIVVEAEHRSDILIHQEFRKFLDQGPFRLVSEIPVQSNRSPLRGQTLKIYEYLNSQPMTAKQLELRLPIVGQTVRVSVDPLRRQLQRPVTTKANTAEANTR